MLKRLRKQFKKDEKGQGMVEFGLILALVSVVAIGALSGIGGQVSGQFDEVVNAVGGDAIAKPDPIYSENEIDKLVSQGYTPISNAEELSSISRLNGKYIQVADIDLSGIDNFEPIGTSNNEFTGIFDGGGYTINNLTIDRGEEGNVGLFGNAENATFRNIGLENVDVTGGRDYVGGLAGYQFSSKISNSYTTGKVNGKRYVGGLVGVSTHSSSISNSYSSCEVNGGNHAGGLAGYQHSSKINNSYATGQVTGSSVVGGLLGYQQDSAAVFNSYATGQVIGEENVGGLVGWNHRVIGKNDSTLIKDSGWASDINTEGVGRNIGTISNVVGQPKSEIDDIIKSLIM